MANQIAFYPPSGGGSGLTLISTATIAGATATFSSIPQTFNNLRIVANFSTTGGGANLVMQFNGDVAADYTYSVIFNNSGTPAGAQLTGANFGIVATSHSGALVIDIPNYHSAALGSTSFTSSSSGAAGNFSSNGGGSWNNTGVASIVLTDSTSSGAMSANSKFYLYGY